MPNIILKGDRKDALWVFSIMLFPNDQGLQDYFYARREIDAELYLSAEHAKRISEAAGISIDKNVVSIGISERALRGIIDAPPNLEKLVENATREGVVAGMCFRAIYEMQYFGYEPSFKKAFYCIKKYSENNTYGDGEKMKISQTKIREYWGKYESVAHLWAARSTVRDYPASPELDVFQGKNFKLFLSCAAGYGKFGSELIVGREKTYKPVLDPQALWLLPPEVEPLRHTPIKPSPFIESIGTYKASTNKRPSC